MEVFNFNSIFSIYLNELKKIKIKIKIKIKNLLINYIKENNYIFIYNYFIFID